MKITIEIDEQEIAEAVMQVIINNAVKTVEKELYGDGRGYNRRIYQDAIKTGVREVIRKNIDDLADRAVEAAAYTISHKALKEKINSILED